MESIANTYMENAIKAIMSTNLETIDITGNAQEAAKKMHNKRISSVLVIDKNKSKEEPVGIITERDLVNRVCTTGASSKEVSARAIMSSPIATIEKEATVESAADLMLSNKVRHLLVVDDRTRRPIGIVAPSDLNKYLRANIDMDEVNARILKAIEAEDMIER
jgi:CBS domain-containing protein